MTDWITLPPGPAAPAAGGGGAPTQGFVPSIDVGGPGYSPAIPAGQPGSELTPSLVGGPGASKDGSPTTHWEVTPAPSHWSGTDHKGQPATSPDPGQLRNPVPVYHPLPAPPPPAQAAPAQPQMVPVPIPQQTPAAPAPQQAPQAPQRMPAGGVSPPELQPPAPPAQLPPQAPQQPQQAPAPMQLSPTVPQQGAPGWGHTTGLIAAKALEGIPLAAAGILDLPQTVGTGLYNYFTAQPTVAGALPQRPLSPELAQAPPPQGEPAPPSGPPQGPQGPFFGRQVERLYNALGLPQPKSENEQTAATLAEALGGTVGSLGLGELGVVGRYAPKLARALSSHPVQQAVGAAGSAGASELARRSGAGPGAQFAAALLGGVGAPMASSMVGGAYRGTRAAFTSPRQIAARQLAQYSSDPATLEARLRAATGSGLGAPQTTAMAANDQGLARVEAALRNAPGAQGILDVEAKRASAISNALQQMHPGTGLTEQRRGEVIRGVLANHDATIGRRVDQLYTTARAQPGTFGAQPAKDAVLASAQKYYGPGSGGAPAAFTNIARQITQRAGLVNNRWVMNMDRQIGDAAREASRVGNNTLAAALGEVRDGVGRISTTAEHTAAKAARARQGAVMGRDASGAGTVGQIMREDKFGRPILTGEQVVHRAVASRAGVQQILNAGNEALRSARASGASAAEINRVITDNAAARTMMREQFLDNAESSARGVGGNYTSAAWRRYWAKNDTIAPLLFNKGEMANLHAISADLADDARMAAMASAKGSHTTQHLAHLTSGNATVANIINAASRGSVAGAGIAGRVVEELPAIIAGVAGMVHGGATHAGAFGTMMHFVGKPIIHAWFERRNDIARATLQEAAANPQFAADLLKAGSAANFARMLQRSKASNGPLWGLIRRLVPAVAGAEAGQTATIGPTPQVAPAFAR